MQPQYINSNFHIGIEKNWSCITQGTCMAHTLTLPIMQIYKLLNEV